jgi:hypothetical protein
MNQACRFYAAHLSLNYLCGNQADLFPNFLALPVLAILVCLCFFSSGTSRTSSMWSKPFSRSSSFSMPFFASFLVFPTGVQPWAVLWAFWGCEHWRPPYIIFLHEVQGHHKGADQENNNEDAKDDIGLGIVTKRCIAQVRQCGGCNQGANNRTEAGNHGNLHKNFAKRPARLFLVGRKFLVLDFAVFGFFFEDLRGGWYFFWPGA